MGISQAILGVPGVMGGGGETDFGQFLIDSYGVTEVWKLTDMTDTTIIAFNNTARNGTATAFDLTAPNAIASPITGETGLAPFLDGTTSYGNILTSNGSTGLVDVFDPNTGSFGIWIKSDRTPLARDLCFVLLTNVNNQLQARYESGGATLASYFHIAGGTSINQQNVNVGNLTDWTLIGVRWDTTAGASGELELTKNGVSQGTIQTGLGTWSGALARAIIGALDTTPNNSMDGNLAYAFCKFGGTLSAADFLAIYNAAVSGPPF